MSKAFEPEERRLPWHSDRWISTERFYEDTESETIHARDRFKFPHAHLDDDMLNKEYWLSVITEEVGKLCQCINKMHIANNTEVKEQWTLEGYHRILCTTSLLRRLAERWEKLP